MAFGRQTTGRTGTLIVLVAGGLALTACGAQPTEEPATSSASSSSTSSTGETTSSPADDALEFQDISPALGMHFDLPVLVHSEKPRILDNGMRQVKYISDKPAPR